jgi:Tfp pilus assembly protein PilN
MIATTCAQGVNLLPASRLAAIRRRSRIRLWILVVGVYVLALFGGWGVMRAHAVPAPKAAKDLDEVAGQIDSRRKELASLRKELGTVQRALEASRAVGQHPDWSVLLLLLADAGSGEVVLSRCDLQVRPAPQGSDALGAEGYVLSLAGMAPSQDVVFQYALSLETLGVFETVQLIGTRAGEIPALGGAGPGLVSFEMSCVLSDAGVPASSSAAPPLTPAAGGAR